VNSRWKLVLDEAAFQFFVSRPAAERRNLFRAFEELRENPHREADYEAKDSAGRALNVWACKPFLITWWRDEFVTEIRIVDIERVHF
jgi:hypothetical protein